MNFKTGITALFLCFSLSAFSQGTMKVTIKVTDGTVKTIPGVEVKLTESSINKTLKQVTDASGITVFTLTEGLSWSISVGGIKEQSTIERSEERSGSRTMTISYDPAYSARISKQTETRTGYSSIPQNYNSLPPLKPGFGLISVEVKTLAKQNVSGVTVGMTCVSQKTIYTATTNSQGIANFQIPVNQNYDIDVEGLLNLSYIDLTARNEKLIQTATVTYDVPKIPQTIDGDTITQNLKGFSKAFSGMAWYVVKVNADRSTPAVKEIVYAQEINGTRFYKATTDAMGKCAFLLPTGHKYMIHFRFQHDVDVIDASNTAGFINGSMEVTYVPNPRLQNPGQFIPGAENLFLIEFENFIKKQFPKPRNKPFDVFLKWGNPKVNKDAKEALLEVMFTADENYDAKNSPPFNICFVIDQSGSMAGYNRIEKVKESLKKYIQQLRSADIISIVVFEDEMKLVIPPKAVGNNKASITEIIEAIQPGGGTNIYNGLVAGYEQVLKNFGPKYTNRVILISDGYGADDVTTTINKSKEYNKKGIDLSAVGVGSDYNYALMKNLATNGGGLFQYVGDSANMDEIFTKELQSVLNPIAKNVSVEIKYNEKIILKSIYGFPVYKQSANLATMSLNSVYPGLTKLAMVKFDLNNPDSSIEMMPVTVKISYTELKTGKLMETEEKAFLKWDPYKGYEIVYDAEEKKLYCIAIMNQAIKVMAESYSIGENKKAKDIINKTLIEVKNLYPEAKDKDVKKLLEELDNYVAIFKNIPDKGTKTKK